MLRRAPTKKRSSSTPSSGLILDISDTLLTTIRDAARVSTVPFFQEAAEMALGILRIIQGTKDNKDGFKYLAGDVCTLVYAIIRISQEQNGLSTKDLDNVKELLGTLASIERFARRETSQPLYLRVIRHKSDVGKIQRYRDVLKHSLDLFELKASISVQESLARIAKRQDELLTALQESLHNKQEDKSLDQDRVETESVEKTPKLERDKLEGLIEQKADVAKERVFEREVQEKAGVERKRAEKQRFEAEQLAQEKELMEAEEQLVQDKLHTKCTTELPHTPRPNVPYPSKNSLCERQRPAFPIVHSSGGSFTTIGGDYIKTDNSHHTTNTNSGNTTTTIITDSNNDSSRVYSQFPRKSKNKMNLTRTPVGPSQ